MQLVFSFLGLAWGVASELTPWLLLGLLVAGLLHVLLPRDFVRRHLGRPGLVSTLKAAALVPLPLCSCGVIPATVGLKKDGASDGACTAFLISTPQTGVDSITVSAAFLGWPFALYKVISALLTGLLGGWIVDLTTPRMAAAVPAAAAAGLPLEPVADTLTLRPRRSLAATLRDFWEFTALELMGSIWRWVFLGILVSAAISLFFPVGSFQNQPWLNGPAGLLLMLVISLPMYVCATGSVPIAAALVAAGFPPGAALVFLMAGPASNAATIGAIWRTFGRRVTLIYLGVLSVTSLLLGWMFGFLLQPARGALPACHLHAGGLTVMGHVWAGVLAAILLAYVLRALVARLRRGPAAVAAPPPVSGPDGTGTLVLQVTGMNCAHCVAGVREALLAVPGVCAAAVDLAAGAATVTGSALDPEALRAAVRRAGFQAR